MGAKEHCSFCCDPLLQSAKRPEAAADPGVVLPYTAEFGALRPTRGHPDDAGIDLYALDDVAIRPGEVVAIRTGIRVAIPPGGSIELIGKSGRAWSLGENRPIGMGILAGLIDEGHRGELVVVAANHNLWPVLSLTLPLGSLRSTEGEIREAIADASIVIPKGKACVQMVARNFRIRDLEYLSPDEFDALPRTSRGGSPGFGSTEQN